MAKDEMDFDDDFNLDDMDSFLDEDFEKPKGPTSKRETVEHAVKDIGTGLKDGLTGDNLKSNLTSLVKNFAPEVMDSEMTRASGIRSALNTEVGKLVKDNKNSINNINNVLLNNFKSDSFVGKLATKLNNKLNPDTGSGAVESVEDIAKSVVNNELAAAMEKMNATAERNIQNLTQQDALNRIYGSLLKQEIFNNSLTSVYYRKSLEYQYIQLATTKKIHEINRQGFNTLNAGIANVVKNTSLPEIVKMRSLEVLEAQAKQNAASGALNKMFGSGGWASKLMNKLAANRAKINSFISDAESAADMYQSSKDMSSMMADAGISPLQSMASMIPNMMTGFVARAIGKRALRTERGANAMDTVKDFLSSPGEGLRSLAGNVGSKGSNRAASWLSDKVSKGLTGVADFIDDDDYMVENMVNTGSLLESAAMDRKTLITQNEVIPALLNKIWKEVHMFRTGKDEDSVDDLKFNYGTRQLSTTKAMASTLNSRVVNNITDTGAASRLNDMSDFILSQSGATYGDAERAKVRKGLTAHMLTGKQFRPSDLKDEFYTQFDPETAKLVRAGMDTINKDTNKDRGKHRDLLRESYRGARESMPELSGLVDAQMRLGNTDLLVNLGLVKFNDRLGTYEVDNDAYRSLIQSELDASDIGANTYNLTPDIIADKESWLSRAKRAITGSKDFKNNVALNLNSNPLTANKVPANWNNMKFSLNRSGSNSTAEMLATEAIKTSYRTANTINNSKAASVIKSNADKLKKGIMKTKAYKELEAKYKELGVEFKKHIVYDDTTINKIATINRNINSFHKTIFTKGYESEYKLQEYYLGQLLENGMIDPLEYSKNFAIIHDRYQRRMNSVDNNITDTLNKKYDISGKVERLNEFKNQTTTDVENLIDAAKTNYNENYKDKTLEEQLKSFEEDVSTTITKANKNVDSAVTKLKANPKYKELETTVKESLEELEIHSVKDLNAKNVLALVKMMAGTKDGTETKANILSYLFMEDKIDSDTLKDNLVELKSDDIENLTPLDRVKKHVDSFKEMSLLKSMKSLKEEYAKSEKLIDDDTLEEAAARKEDSRISKIVTAVLEKVNSKKTPDADDVDGDGKRDGSWMTKIKSLTGRNKSTEIGGDITNTVKQAEKSGNPLMSIASMLLGGIPAIIGAVGSVATGIGTAVSVLTSFPAMLTGLFNGLGSLITGALGLASGGGLPGVELGPDGKPKKGKNAKPPAKRGFLGKVAGTVGKYVGALPKAVGIVGSGLGYAGKAVSMVGKGALTVGKYALRKLPWIGAAAGGYAAYDYLKNNDTMNAAYTGLSTSLAQIPVVGTIGSIGVDIVQGAHNLYNDLVGSKIDKDLYNDGFPVFKRDALDKLILNHIRKEETGSAAGKYNIAKDIGDGAGISFGAYQFTESSGNIKTYVARIYKLTKDPAAESILTKFGDGAMYNGNKKDLIKFLKESGDTKAGRSTQDSMYFDMFVRPVKRLARHHNITHPAVILQLVDHGVNAGLGGVKSVIARLNGRRDIESVMEARKAHYNAIIVSKPSKAKYRKVWYARVDNAYKVIKPSLDQARAEAEKDNSIKIAANDIDQFDDLDGAIESSAIPVASKSVDPLKKSRDEAIAMLKNPNATADQRLRAQAILQGGSTTTKPTTNKAVATAMKDGKAGIQPTVVSSGSKSSANTKLEVNAKLDSKPIESAIGSSNNILSSIATNTANMANTNKELIEAIRTLKGGESTLSKPTTIVDMGVGTNVKRGSTVG